MSASTLEGSPRNADPEAAYRRGSAALVARQHLDGCFEGEMVWNTMILSQRVIVGRIVGRDPDDALRAGMIRHYESTVMAAGCWGRNLEGDPSLFCTTLAYVALRLLGLAPEETLLAAARRWIHQQPDGVLAIPTWGKLWLAMIGLYDYSGINPFPPELFLLPKRLPAHPDQLYCHTRAIYTALAYLYGRRFRVELGELGVALAAELYGTPPSGATFAAHRSSISSTDLHVTPSAVLRGSYRLLVGYERVAPPRLRERALRRCLARIHDEQRASAGQGLSPVSGALECLAMFAADPLDPAVGVALEGLERWRFEDEAGGVRYAGARSQTWDTAFAVEALLADASSEPSRPGGDGVPEGGDPVEETLVRACQFLRRAQLREELAPPSPEGRSPVLGGWCFSDGAHRWPVSDCAAEAVGALLHAGAGRAGEASRDEENVAGSDWLAAAAQFVLARQNPDGGFGTYERRRGPRWLESLNPAEMFSNCMVEGSYVECTGSSLAALCALRELTAGDRANPGLSAWVGAGRGRETSVAWPSLDEPIARGVSFLRRSQRGDGSFAGTWGINFTYGTAFALRGLRAAGVGPGDPTLRNAATWLASTQAGDGGWGEHRSSCTLGRYVGLPVSQPVMTSWAVLGLLDATGDPSSAAVRRGVEWLCAAQRDDGSWPAGALNGVFFGTGMLHYELYPTYFPLWALGRYLAADAGGGA